MSRASRSIRHPIILAFALVALAACESVIPPGLMEGPPDALEFTIASYGGSSSVTRLEGDEIVVVSGAWDGPKVDTLRVVPTAAAWRAFWDAAQEAGIHRWRSSYVAENFLDGTGWSLTIEGDGIEVDSHGSNAYPDSRGGGHIGEFTESFRIFRSALAQLAGVDPAQD